MAIRAYAPDEGVASLRRLLADSLAHELSQAEAAWLVARIGEKEILLVLGRCGMFQAGSNAQRRGLVPCARGAVQAALCSGRTGLLACSGRAAANVWRGR
jgi:hypothetical protein